MTLFFPFIRNITKEHKVERLFDNYVKERENFHIKNKKARWAFSVYTFSIFTTSTNKKRGKLLQIRK